MTLITGLNQVVVTVGGACDAPAAAVSRVEWKVEFSFGGSESGWEKEKCKVTRGSDVSK